MNEPDEIDDGGTELRSYRWAIIQAYREGDLNEAGDASSCRNRLPGVEPFTYFVRTKLMMVLV